MLVVKLGAYALSASRKYKTRDSMKPGEKYLTIKVLGDITLRAFNNSEARKENKNAPHFKGEGVAVWINEKKEKPEEEDYCDRLL